MNTKTIISTILFLTYFSASGQFRKQNIETDSSEIQIIRNSVYHVYEEAYKNKDSVWFSVHFIKDTTRLNTEGWKTKENKYLGVWREYNFEGQLLYTRDYDNASCIINKDLYPYHHLVEKMKSKADSLIISTYSQEFFENFVRFNFNCSAYDEEGYVGSWTKPLKRRPTEFLFRYSVKIGETDWFPEMIGITLDSLGKYVPNSDDRWNRYGFEEVKGNKRTFNIDRDDACKIATKHGLVLSDTTEISEFLTWENFQNQTFYNGRFRYYITELTGKTEYNKGDVRKGIIYRFNVYSFNPWTGEFIEMKKMKSRKEWGKHSGHITGLIPDN
ncbi:hypothetical protein PP178_00735 [Zeaxanthinibacter sp. PT1]|uniref:hypothetical protein n=1 Tax=Zeaxanthinibacter TaxID=561554 RepID=UPI0023498B43|nr:hypothetical protein [Zeaxanthinibacter sp. PT1]MDC6350062.1 hypothetical protein [Zeaxanthinibacter sp. PT1]